MKNEVRTKVMIAGTAFCAALFLFSGFMLCREYLDQEQSAETFREAVELVKEEPDLSVLKLESGPELVQGKMAAFDKCVNVYVQNSDSMDWVSIPGTRTDYPVMQTKDNPDFYLRRALDKSYGSYGVPYVQENCGTGISDNPVLYGHHMDNGSMFSDLCKYESEDFYQEHRIIHLDTLESFGECEVIAVFKTVAYPQEELKYYHFVQAESAKQFDEYIAECRELMLYDIGVTAEYGDKLIILPTCEHSWASGQMVVLVKLLEE